MRQVGLVIAVALLGTAVAGCADPYRPRYSYAQTYPATYTVYQTAPAQVAYVYPTGYATSYGSRSYDRAYDRHYMGIHPGPELQSYP
jgi:hypothetical protein